MIVHMVCTFDDICPEEASAPGIKPERIVRPSETTGFQPKGRKVAIWCSISTSQILPDQRLMHVSANEKYSEQISNLCTTVYILHGAVPKFHLSSHSTRFVRNRRR